MKKFRLCVYVIFITIFAVACGSVNSNDNGGEAAREWIPFNQNIERTNAFETTTQVIRSDYTSSYFSFEDYLVELLGEEFALEYIRLIDVLNTIIDYFGSDNFFYNIFNDEYFDFIGGVTIESRNGVVRFLLVEGLEYRAADFLKFVYGNDSIVVDSTNISLRELSLLVNEVWTAVFDDDFGAVSGINYQIRQQMSINRVIVYIEDITDEKIELFRALVFDSPIIIFEDMDDFDELIFW